MYSVSRYLVSPIVDCTRADNDKASGGLPHSEIFGSKPIPGSPKLIAGYHVLHRLLLPRHPPNALLALDPIQRRTGLACAPLCSARPHPPRPRGRSPGRKSYIFPPHGRVRPWNIRLVYLTWNKTAVGQAVRPPQVTPTLGRTSGSDVSLSSRLSNAVRIGRKNTEPSALRSDPQGPGGSRRTRTSDLTLIRRAL